MRRCIGEFHNLFSRRSPSPKDEAYQVTNGAGIEKNPGNLERSDSECNGLSRSFMKAISGWMLAALLGLLPRPLSALTIDGALAMAKENFPVIKAAQFQVKSSDALYKASLSPYLPSLDAATSQEQHYATVRDYDQSNYDVTLTYTLFDGGKRKANRDIARSNLNISEDTLATNNLELEFKVKSAFYGTIARRDIVREREIELHNANKDFEIAQGRHRLGVAKLSDVLQASVRLEQARYNLVQAQGDLSKGIAELNSLLGRPLETDYDLEGSLDFQPRLPPRETLERYALQRPEIRQAESSILIAKSNVTLQTSPFFPTITANGSYSRTDGSLVSVFNEEDSAVGIFATWNLFELDKFYRRKSAQMDVRVSEENLNETTRQVLLNLSKAYDDFLTDSKNVVVAQEQFKASEQNYAQALGEYRVGKGDILSLVVAESGLARSREQLTLSKLSFILSKALLERTAGIEKLELLSP